MVLVTVASAFDSAGFYLKTLSRPDSSRSCSFNILLLIPPPSTVTLRSLPYLPPSTQDGDNQVPKETHASMGPTQTPGTLLFASILRL